jgi:hypothetical protein
MSVAARHQEVVFDTAAAIANQKVKLIRAVS